MTEQTEVEALQKMNAPIWEVGKTYKTHSRCYTARILATNLRNKQPIAAVLRDDEGNEEVWQFGADGAFSFSGRGAGQDLTAELA